MTTKEEEIEEGCVLRTAHEVQSWLMCLKAAAILHAGPDNDIDCEDVSATADALYEELQERIKK